MNGWCSMIIWYVSYVANMYLWVFHGIPFLLHLVLSCTVWQVSRQISSERMRNGIGTLKVTATGATNEFLVSEKTSEKNPVPHIWPGADLYLSRGAAGGDISSVSQQLQLVHLVNPCQWNAAILLRSRKSLKATTPGNGSVTDLFPSQADISCLSKFS